MAPVVVPVGYLDDFEHMSYHLCSKHVQIPGNCHCNQQGGGDNEVQQHENPEHENPEHENPEQENPEQENPGGYTAGQYKMRPVWAWEELEPGMFCYVKYCGFWHAVLVTAKKSEKKTIKAIHFAWPSLFSSRVIKEEKFQVNLGKDELWEVFIPQNKRVPADVALQRAREKIGQNGFNMFWRRSSHVVRECVEV